MIKRQMIKPMAFRRKPTTRKNPMVGGLGGMNVKGGTTKSSSYLGKNRKVSPRTKGERTSRNPIALQKRAKELKRDRRITKQMLQQFQK